MQKRQNRCDNNETQKWEIPRENTYKGTERMKIPKLECETFSQRTSIANTFMKQDLKENFKNRYWKKELTRKV